MRHGLQRRVRVEVALMGVSFILFGLTVVFPEWIEALTGFEPDGGSGALEFVISGAFLVAAIAFGVLARRDYRRLALEQG
jgi:hypothetical protein